MQEDDENAAVDEEDKGTSDDEEAQSQGAVSLLDISNSDNEEAHKAAACEKVAKVMSILLLGETNRSTRGMKP